MTAEKDRLLQQIIAALTDVPELDAQFVTAKVLPVVQALMDECAAAELEKAAQVAETEFMEARSDEGNAWARVLRARAAALRAATTEGGTS